MEKINVAELLKDCPQGMELDCILFKDTQVYLWNITTDPYYPIEIKVEYPSKELETFSLNKYGAIYNRPTAKCIIFPKGKTTWKEDLGSFKDGDILTTRAGSIFILKESYEDTYSYGCYVALDFEKAIIKNSERFCNKEGCRLATEEEKKELFNTLQAKGYKWNAETKKLEKLIKPKFKVGDIIQDKDGVQVRITKVNLKDELYTCESLLSQWVWYICFDEGNNWELALGKFDISTLKPFDKVLVRDEVGSVWHIQLFENFDITHNYPYVCIGYNNRFKQCIPYEGNEHLLGNK